MRAVLLDFNGTMFFDSSLHSEAWSKIYRELHPDASDELPMDLFCGPVNEVILQGIAPWLTPEENRRFSQHKEAVYRSLCYSQKDNLHLVSGIEQFMRYLQEHDIPYGLASASIKSNIDFYFEFFGLDRWFKKEDVVYDDGTYPHKGAMHLEAARRLGVGISECLVVEDSPSAVSHAKSIGAGCIVALGNTATADKLLSLGADHYVKDFNGFDYSWLERSIPRT